MKVLFLFFIIWFAVSSLLLLGFGIYGTFKYPIQEKVIQGDCFDRFGNKINGVTCDIVNYTRELPEFMTIILIGLSLSMAISFTVILFLLHMKEETR